MLNKKNCQKIFYLICIFVILLPYYFLQFSLVTELVTSKQLFEPSESDMINIFLYYSNNLNFKNLEEFIHNGIFPIFPDFFSYISSITFKDPIIGQRKLNVLFFVLIIVLVSAYAYRARFNRYLIPFIPMILFGPFHHSYYLLLARTDTSSLFFGLLSIIINGEAKKNNFNFLITINVGVFSAISILCRQTGVLFLAINIIIIFFNHINLSDYSALKFKDLKKTILNLLFYFFIIGIFLLIYTIFIGQQSLSFFWAGLNLYSLISSEHLVSMLWQFSLNKYHLTFLLASITIFSLNKNKVFINNDFIIFLITIIFSLIIFTNPGGVNNYFFFINIISFYIVIKNYNYLNKYLKIFTVFLLFYLCSLGFYNFIDELKLKSMGRNFINLNKENDFENSLIFLKIKSGNITNQQILTDRLDNYLYYAGQKINYQGGILTPIHNGLTKYNNKYISVNNALNKNKEKIVNNIINQKYDFILIGITDKFFKETFPELNKYYKISLSEKITQGTFSFQINLYEPSLNHTN